MNKFSSEYEGGAFHPKLPKGKIGGTVSLEGAFVSFHSESICFQLPLDGIEIKMGGAADRLIFFSHPEYTDQIIYSRDQKILNDPQLESQQVTRRQWKNVQRDRFKKRVWLFAACALVFVVFSGAYFLKDPAVSFIAKKLPPDLEESLGKNLIDQYKASNVFIEDTEVDKQLSYLVAPLIDSIASNRYEFTFYIVQDPSLNAFALPGGHIVVHTGLILGASRAEEILGVIAHEMAHVNRQHGIRKVLEGAGSYVVLSSLFGDVSGVTAVLVSNGAFLIQQQFSREFEREADQLAVTYLVDADVDPSGLYDFFAKLKAKEENSSAEVFKALSFLSTHPATVERMESLNKAIDEAGKRAYSSTNFDLAALQKLLYETDNSN